MLRTCGQNLLSAVRLETKMSSRGDTVMYVRVLMGILLGAWAFNVASVAFAGIVQWVDTDGVVHYSDSAAAADAGARVQPKDVKLFQPDPGVTVAPSSSLPAPTSTSAANTPTHSVVLYTTSWCPYCKRAREFLRREGIAFTDYDVEKDAAAARRKAEYDKQRGSQGVPLAIIDNVVVSGFSEETYRRVLGLPAKID